MTSSGREDETRARLLDAAGEIFSCKGFHAATVREITKTARANVAAMPLAGGMLMAFGAHLARGCTSGQALTGGALLNVGSWAFMLMVFVGGYAVAWFFRWQWR